MTSFKPHLRAIHQVFVLPVAIHDALDDDLLEIDIEQSFRIIKSDLHARAILPRHRGRTAPDEVFAALASASIFIDCSPSTKRNASATLDFPEPLGPTIDAIGD